jgi:hypothetical protein
MLRSLLPLVLPLAIVTAACGDDSFHVQHAAEFPKGGGATLSVFGVYKDGRLAPEGWDPLRTHLTPLFGATTCEPGYPDILTPSGAPVLQAVDDYSRANGVTDELLDRLSASAKGDLVLLITETGRPGVHVDNSNAPASSGPPTLRAGGRRGGATQAGPKKPVPEASTFEMVGLVFSVHAHKTVAAIRMTYAGASMDDALQAFMERLGSELPRSTCAGWKSDLHLEVGDVRRLDTE